MPPKKRPRRLLEQAKNAARRLELEQLEQLDTWLHATMRELERTPAPEPSSPGFDRRVRGRVTYQRELVRCGKPRCHCSKGGKPHGPYWYAYHWRGGRVRKLYIGKFLKDDD